MKEESSMDTLNKELWIAPVTINNSSLIESKGRNYISVRELAKTVVCFNLAKKTNFTKPDVCLTDIQAIQVMYTFLKSSRKAQEILGLKHLDWDTAIIVYKSLNLIRMNKVAGGLTERVKRVQKLVGLFESYLKDQHLTDYPMLLNNALWDLQDWEADQCFFCPVMITEEAKRTLNGNELEFLEKLQDLTNGGSCSISKSDGTINSLSNNDPKSMHFFSGYGISNEIKYMAEQIFSKKMQPGEISIYYSCDAYEPFIISELEGRSIPLSFTSGRSTVNDNLFQLILDILTWKKNDYAIEDFYTILNNPVLKHGSELLEFLAKRSTEFHLGNGLTRYLIFEEYYQTGKGKAAMKPEVSELYQDLLAFARVNCVIPFLKEFQAFCESGNVKDDELIDRDFKLLEEIREDLTFLPETENDFQILQKEIENSKITELSDPCRVAVSKLSDFSILTRKYNFFLGFSQSYLQPPKKQEYLFRDKDMACLDSKGYVPTKDHQRKRILISLVQTISTAQSEIQECFFSYPTYDTASFLKQNPSGFLVDLLSLFYPGKTLDDIPVYDFGVPVEDKERFNIIPLKSPWEFRKTSSGGPNCSESASSLEKFAYCPREYYWKYQERVSTLELPQIEENQWLNAADRGLFVHSLLQRYMDKVFKSVTHEELIKDPNYSAVQQREFDSVFDDLSESYRNNIPAKGEWLISQDLEEIREKVLYYLGEVHRELASDNEDTMPWEYLVSEFEFLIPDYSLPVFDKTEIISLHGFIDRIDFCLDESQKKIHLRILDYKTGKKIYFYPNSGYKLQKGLYPTALMDDKVQGELRKAIEHKYKRTFNDYQIEVDSFIYVFPMDINLREVKEANTGLIKQIPTQVSAHKFSQWNLGLAFSIWLSRETNSFPRNDELSKYLKLLRSDIPYLQSHPDDLKTLESMVKTTDANCKYCDYRMACGKEDDTWNQN